MDIRDEVARDWTIGAKGGSNSSPAYLECVAEVQRILSSHRLGADLEQTARSIVSRLAHVYRLAPRHDRTNA